MRILFVNVYYYPVMVGGTEHSVKILCEGLQKKGHDVAVYCLAIEQNFSIDNVNGVLVYRGMGGLYDVRNKIQESKISDRKLLNKLVELNNFGAAKELERVIHEFRPDLLHTNNLNGVSTACWKVAWKLDIPIVHTVRDYWLLSYTYTTRNNVLDRFYAAMQKRYSHCVSVVTGASTFITERFSRAGFFPFAQYKTIPNSIPFNSYELRNNLEQRRRRIHHICFMYAGYLDRTKGVDVLLEAIRAVSNKKLSFHFFGDGPLKEQIAQAAEKDPRIRFFGKVNGDEMLHQYQQADVVVVPSVWEEPFGRVLIEGFSQGCTVIAHDVGGMPEIVETMQAGILYHENSELIQAINAYSSRSRIIEDFDAIERNIEKYHLNKQIDAFEQEYRALYAKKGRTI